MKKFEHTNVGGYAEEENLCVMNFVGQINFSIRIARPTYNGETGLSILMKKNCQTAWRV